MEFDWDPEKWTRNIIRHGVDFEDAIRIFESAVVEYPDERQDYGEERWSATGIANGVELYVVYTDRKVSGTIVRRIISARKANKHERQELYETIYGKN